MIRRLLITALLPLACFYASAQPANDSCANAIALTVGTGICNSAQYDNTGATVELTDPIPSCWVPASISNTVWFTFVPDSQRVHISTNFTGYTLANTQVAVYSGTCGAFTEIACQEDIYAFNGYYHTDMIVNGLTIGNTYYIMVDGNGSNVGTFGICVENLGPPIAAIPAEDCFTATYLCDTSMIIVATNTNTSGSVQEQQYCFLVTNDPGAHWYQFTALTSGNLCFDIYANDGTTDYDWAVYDVTNGCPGFALDCDYTASAGIATGLGCASIACHPCLAIGAGSTYAILVSRRTANSTGFNLNFTTTTALFGGVPIPTFIHNDSICAGQQAVFTNTSTTQNQNLSFVWNFGDGYTSIETNPTHSYAAAGNYNVTLIATCGSSSNVQTSSITILPPLPASVTPTSSTICNGDSVTLIGSATYNQSLLVPLSFTNTTPVPIPDFPNPGIQSDIVVSGVIPPTFFANPLISVCLNITHTWDADLQIFLKAPDGSQMALALNNGGSGDNFTGTCFVPVGAPNISTGTAPFTGDFTPFDNFSPAFDFTGNNGTWSLLITDVAGGDVGVLQNWTITFNTQNYLTYSWTPSAGLTTTTNDTTVAMPSVSTNYTFIATDATGCPGMASTQVNVTNTPQSTFSVNSTTLCIDEPATFAYTGSASSNATFTWNFGSGTFISGSGSASDPYFYSWSTAGTDSVTLIVQDSSCTSATTVVYITINPPPTVNTTGSDTLVCEGTSIDLFANSSPSATYTWTGPGGFNSNSQNPVIPGATFSMTGLYFVYSTDNGCPSALANVFVQVIPTPVANATSNSPVCDEGTIMLMTPATLGGSYSWTGPNSYSSTLMNPAITPATFSDAGVYTVTVSAGGCSGTPSNVTIVISPLPDSVVASSNSPICEGSDLFLYSDTFAVGETYSWTGPNSFSDSNQNPVRTGTVPSDSGPYIVARTVNGCTSHSQTVNVQVDQKIFASLPESEIHTCMLDTVISANDPAPAIGIWSLVSGTGSFASPNSFTTAVLGVDTGVSVYQWTVINGTCYDSIQLTVIHDGIDTCGTLETNELITPNNDGLNERLIFTGLFQYPQNTLVIFNRWGSEVFSQNNYRNEWRGRTEVGSAGDELPDGTYYYVLTVPGRDSVKGFIEVKK